MSKEIKYEIKGDATPFEAAADKAIKKAETVKKEAEKAAAAAGGGAGGASPAAGAAGAAQTGADGKPDIGKMAAEAFQQKKAAEKAAAVEKAVAAELAVIEAQDNLRKKLQDRLDAEARVIYANNGRAEAEEKVKKLTEKYQQRLERQSAMIRKNAGKSEKAEYKGEGDASAIAKGIKGLVAGMALNEGKNLLFSSMKSQTGDNRNVNAVEGVATGALTGATAGAMFGPVGMLVGGIGGALFSALGEADKRAKARKQEEYDRGLEDRQNIRSNSMTMFREAMTERMGGMSRQERMEERNRQIRNLTSGGGEDAWNLKNLEKYAKDHAGDDSQEAQERIQRLKELKQERAALQLEQARDALKVEGRMKGADEYGDAMSRRGLGVGGTVNVRDVNQPVIDQIKNVSVLLGKILDVGMSQNTDMSKIVQAAGFGAIAR